MKLKSSEFIEKTTLFMEENGFVYKTNKDFFVKSIIHNGNEYELHIGFSFSPQLNFYVPINIHTINFYTGKRLFISEHKTSYCLEIDDDELYCLLFKYMVRDVDKLMTLALKIEEVLCIYYYSHKEGEFALSMAE